MSVHIFTTGGTIDKTYFDAKSEYQVGSPQISTVLEEANATVEYFVTSLMRKDSLELTIEDRKTIREAVCSCSQKHILITHGTDTMIDTAKTLSDIPDKTIVLTGSLSPARFRETDALFNIGFALAAAQTLSAGVYIAINGQVFDPHDVQKNYKENKFERVSREK
jgi:L-asparaginase